MFTLCSLTQPYATHLVEFEFSLNVWHKKAASKELTVHLNERKDVRVLFISLPDV